jgi:hypothetical protein
VVLHGGGSASVASWWRWIWFHEAWLLTELLHTLPG